MRISYKKLWMLLLERDIKKASLRHEVGLSAGTWTKLNKGEEVSLSILLRICDYLNCDIGDEEYLMMWFRRPEFDRECWFMTDGSVRGGITWDDLCRVKLPVPSYARQCEIIESYRAITNRIALKRAENDNLAA